VIAENLSLAEGDHDLAPVTAPTTAQGTGAAVNDVGATDCSVPIESAISNDGPTAPTIGGAFGATETIECTLYSDIPETWAAMIERMFAGKEFGTSGFGHDFQIGLLVQVADANRALDQEADLAIAGRYCLTSDAINDIIDSCNIISTPSTTRFYVQEMIIATAREDIGRSYLKALQARGQYLGTSYDLLVRSLTEPTTVQPSEEAAIAAEDTPANQVLVGIDPAYAMVGASAITCTQ
jgi:hypothetical protein